MSCRHDLALTTCRVCYPDTGTVTPTEPATSLDGPGACTCPDGYRGICPACKARSPWPWPKIHAEVDALRAATSRDADEIRALREENARLRKRVELLRRLVLAEMWGRKEQRAEQNADNLFEHGGRSSTVRKFEQRARDCAARRRALLTGGNDHE